jgi:hypothetical protein
MKILTSDELLSGGESVDDGTSRRYLEFNANIYMEKPEFKLCMILDPLKSSYVP